MRCGILGLLALSCGGKLIVDHAGPGGGGLGGSVAAAGSSGAQGGIGAGGGLGHTGGSGIGTGGASAGGIAHGGSAAAASGGSAGAATGGAGPGGASGSGGAVGCGSDYECPAPAKACRRSVCAGGLCTTVVDQNQVPNPNNPCLAGTCNSVGTPGTEPLAVGRPCSSSSGGVVCDGIGNCVECLHSADCGQGKICSASKVCEVASCTDVDCGGACPACAVGKHCAVDADCASNACDSVTLMCIADHCFDHHQDGTETDADCGGAVCTGCAIGKGCRTDVDCASHACDMISLTCVSSQCNDHRQDGDETDVDCGGSICGIPCASGAKCRYNTDCASGFCMTAIPRVCA